MKTLEVTAATVEEAVEMAAKKLGVDAKDIQATVLEETQGLFGKGKVRVRAEAIEPDDQPSEPEAEEVADEPEPEPDPATEAEEQDAPAADDEPEPPQEEPDDEQTETAEAEPRAEDTRPDVTATDEDADRIIGMLNQLLEAGEFDSKAVCTGLNGRYVNVEIDGEDTSYLVGRRGEVLNALQYLMNVFSSRKLANGVRVVLEGNNYRERRETLLTKLAEDIAAEVANRKEEAVLDALPAFERRIVHKALVDYEGVRTYSEGEEPNRRVVVAPANQ
ncbi:MAG: KH domain-containing protein [Armatimonadetes bacterium]|nr:KH domain-containing protein [Armatimonadota bacterium]